jgi:catechol 2,3-dioxygenase-like lactoylglutathione lyase family enzyme
MFTTIHHVAVHCSDLSRSVQFYTECFGFSVSSRRDRPDGSGIAFVRLGGMALELTQRPDRKEPMSGMHFAVEAEDMADVVAHLTEKGVEMTLPPTAPRSANGNPNARYRAVFTGPDGEHIEVLAPYAAGAPAK